MCVANNGENLQLSELPSAAGTVPRGEALVVCLALLFPDRNITPCHHQ